MIFLWSWTKSDYNYDVGSNYYKGMINHLDKKSAGVSTEPPGPKSYAERIAVDPIYGRNKPVNYVSSEIPSSGRPSVDFARDVNVGDYLTDDDSLGRSRPGHYRTPTVSDQIMDYAGLKSDHMMEHKAAAAGSDFTSTLDSKLNKRRNMLRDLDEELATLDNEMERNRSSRKAALAALDSSDSAMSSLSQLSSSASSSVNIKKRTMKTTVTSETVRY